MNKNEQKNLITSIIKNNKKCTKAILLSALSLIIVAVIIFGGIFAVNRIRSIFDIYNAFAETGSSEEKNKKEKIYFQYTPANGFYVDIIEGLERNFINNEKIGTENGLRTYEDKDSGITALKGIDVSEFQDEIDWVKVKNAGIDFAMIRAGYRGYSQGGIFEDSKFKSNIEGALANDIKVGVYFFSQAVTPEEAEEEAEFVIKLIKDYEISCPVVFDWELMPDAEARANKLDPEMLNQCAAAFCTRVKKDGYEPMIYFNEYLGYMYYDLGQFKDIDFWYVEYSDTPDFYYAFDFWQYSDSGYVDGISGTVDLNLMFIKNNSK